MNRFAGVLIPYDGGLALIGNSDCPDIGCSRAHICHCLLGNFKLCGPDLLRVVLYPARLREILCKFFLGNAAHFTLLIEKYAAVAGGSGIECHDVLCHVKSLHFLSVETGPTRFPSGCMSGGLMCRSPFVALV